MTDRNSILDAFWDIADILRNTLPPHEIAELPATFFFLKAVTDSPASCGKQHWLRQYPDTHKDLAHFSWEKLAHEKDASEALLWLLRKIENKIPPLFGLSEESKLAHLTRAKLLSEVQLRQLFEKLNAVSLDEFSSGELAEIFQQLLDGMAERSACNSVTPPSIRRLIVELVKPKSPSLIYDPVCGSASLLCDAARTLPESEMPICLYGQDLQPEIVLVAKMNVLLGGWNSDICVGDTLAFPKHTIEGTLKTFDTILANPPFGVRLQREQVENDMFHRFESTHPISIELGIIQHVAKSLTNNGRGAILVTNGFLFRSGGDYRVRKNLVEANRIQAIIALPTHLFSGTTIAASVLILNGPNRTTSEKSVVFVDLSTFAHGQKTRRHLSEKGIEIATICVEQISEQEGVSAVVPKEVLLANDYDLSVSRYVQPTTVAPHLELELDKLTSAIEERNLAEKKAISLLNAVISQT